MSINKILFGNQNQKYASSFRRGTAAMIDIWITLFVRAVFAQIIGSLFLNKMMTSFLLDFKNEFGTDTPKNTPEHITYIFHHSFFYYMLIFYTFIILIGAVYHAYLNSSTWNGTIGKRTMKIMITTKNELPISFGRGLLHYFLSVVPFVFLFYILIYQISHEVNFYQAITSSDLNVFLSIVFVMWLQIQIFTKTKVTAYDLITNTVMTNGRTDYKWPCRK